MNHASRLESPSAPLARKEAVSLRFEWVSAISDEEWTTYQEAIDLVSAAGADFMLGGGFAQATFTKRWRSTKDIDLYIRPEMREPVLRALSRAGFADYYSRLPYDRQWIYRSTKRDVLVDVMWSMANQRAVVDASWFEHAHTITIKDREVKVLPMEEFLWCKLYIVQRDRCDWVDIFNLLYSHGPNLDWRRLIARVEDDWPLLQGLLAVYSWLHPEKARELPHSVFEQLGLTLSDSTGGRAWQERVRLLDSRDWFSGLKGEGEKMEI
jgi:hypothetical protein